MVLRNNLKRSWYRNRKCCSISRTSFLKSIFAESLALARSEAGIAEGCFRCHRYIKISWMYMYMMQQIRLPKNAHDAIYSFASPENAEKLIKAVDTLAAVKGVNVKDARRRIADKLIADNAYKF